MSGAVLVAAAALACLAGPLRAQATRELTVEEAVRLGLAQNAGVRAAGADADAARASHREARAGRLPWIRGQGSYTRLSGNIPGVEFTVPGIDSTFTFQGVQLDRYHGELSVEQPVFTGFRLRHEIRAASHGADAAGLRAEQALADVAFEIRRAYWELARAQSVREAVEGAVAHVETHLAHVRRRLEEGAALTRDLLSAETRRAEMMVERVSAENGVRVGTLELNRLMGLPLDTPLSLAGETDVGLPAETLEMLTAEALAGKPEINAMESDVHSLEAHAAATRAARLPELTFVGRYVYARPNPYFFADQDRFRPTWELGFSARWSMWEGGRESARTAAAVARREAAQARLVDAREQVAVEVAGRYLELQRAADAVAAAALNVSAAEETFRVARQQFDEGAALTADVLDAEQALWRARSRHAEAVADGAIARAALLHARGRIR